MLAQYPQTLSLTSRALRMAVTFPDFARVTILSFTFEVRPDRPIAIRDLSLECRIYPVVLRTFA